VASELPLTEQSAKLNPAIAFVIALCAWIVPGLGHLLTGRRGRAAVLFIVTAGLTLVGFVMRGEVFTPRSGDTFGTLGFLADAGAGVFYFLARSLATAGPDLARATGDYGSRFFAAAGIVNLLGVLDAYRIARARRG